MYADHSGALMPSIARVASSFQRPPHSSTTSRLTASHADSESRRTPSRSKMTASIKRGTRESNPDLRFWRPPSSPLDQSPNLPSHADGTAILIGLVDGSRPQHERTCVRGIHAARPILVQLLARALCRRRVHYRPLADSPARDLLRRPLRGAHRRLLGRDGADAAGVQGASQRYAVALRAGGLHEPPVAGRLPTARSWSQARARDRPGAV